MKYSVFLYITGDLLKSRIKKLDRQYRETVWDGSSSFRCIYVADGTTPKWRLYSRLNWAGLL